MCAIMELVFRSWEVSMPPYWGSGMVKSLLITPNDSLGLQGTRISKTLNKALMFRYALLLLKLVEYRQKTSPNVS